MRIAPLDLRQQRFKTALRGFDKTEVVAFLTEAADDYEHALREIDRPPAGSAARRVAAGEHRDREANLRNTLVTAQRLADEIKDAAQNEAKMIVKEAQGRADLLLQKAQLGSRRSSATSTRCGSGAAASRARSGVDSGPLSRPRVHPRTGSSARGQGAPPSPASGRQASHTAPAPGDTPGRG